MKYFCKSCGQISLCHINTWMEEFSNQILPTPKLPRRFLSIADILLEKIFILPGLGRWKSDFDTSDIQLRSTCFINEMKKRGATCYSLHSFGNYLSLFKMSINGKIFRFEGLPLAEFASKYGPSITDDKELAKRHCNRGGFPISEGKSFWFWQTKNAIQFGRQIGFPLVVKPRGGSVSRHVTTEIQNEVQLKKAIHYAVVYSPAFIIERFIPNASVVRATVIDFNFVACVRQVPANIVGNGISTVRDLIDAKNCEPNRGEPNQNQFTLYRIVEDDTTKELLAEADLDHLSIPEKGRTVYLQKNPFLKLGGDLIEVTPSVHEDNLKLFRDLARHFDIRLTGIDFLVGDISRSWKEQPCAILELNSLPCIELHHFPYLGIPTDPAKALGDMFTKYYLQA